MLSLQIRGKGTKLFLHTQMRVGIHAHFTQKTSNNTQGEKILNLASISLHTLRLSFHKDSVAFLGEFEMGGRGELDIALDDAIGDRFAIEALHIDTLGDALDIAFRHLVRQVNDHQDHVVILHLRISHEGRIGALEESGRRTIGFLASA